jgi:hypothetical protein
MTWQKPRPKLCLKTRLRQAKKSKQPTRETFSPQEFAATCSPSDPSILHILLFPLCCISPSLLPVKEKPDTHHRCASGFG